MWPEAHIHESSLKRLRQGGVLPIRFVSMQNRIKVFAQWGLCEQQHPLDNLALDRTMHAVEDWFSTRKAWCRDADKVASEIAHTRGPA